MLRLLKMKIDFFSQCLQHTILSFMYFHDTIDSLLLLERLGTIYLRNSIYFRQKIASKIKSLNEENSKFEMQF